HVLRRQARLLRLDPRPLVLLTPKSLLRHPLAASSPGALAEGRFQPVLARAHPQPEQARRLVLCSGKVAVDVEARGRLDPAAERFEPRLALARVEELYPFPAREIEAVVRGFPRLEEVVWLQEEPRNM